jgi:hypothetical protein
MWIAQVREQADHTSFPWYGTGAKSPSRTIGNARKSGGMAALMLLTGVPIKVISDGMSVRGYI